jgi:hypothetical protein
MLRNLTTLVVDLHGEARYTTEVAEREKNALENLTYKIRIGEGTFAIHLLVSEITPIKKMIDSKQRIVSLEWRTI